MAQFRKIKAGIVGFGEVNTPRQFINGRCEAAVKLLENEGMEVFVTPPVSDDPAGNEAARAKSDLAKHDFDLLIICIAGWIPSWAVFSVIEKFKHKPMILWGLSGWQEGDRFVTTADQAGTTALRKPMADMGYTFKYVVTYRNCKPDIASIMDYAMAARATTQLRDAKIGMAGYRDMRLYGTLYDGVSLKAKIGPEIEHFDLLEIAQLMEKTNEADITKISQQIQSRWHITKTPKPGTLENSIRLFLAFKNKIQDRQYQGFSFSDVDGVKKLFKFAPAGSMMKWISARCQKMTASVLSRN